MLLFVQTVVHTVAAPGMQIRRDVPACVVTKRPLSLLATVDLYCSVNWNKSPFAHTFASDTSSDDNDGRWLALNLKHGLQNNKV